VLAHRGLATEAPENTLLAFLQALSQGATHLETDVHASHDGVAVLSHDSALPHDGPAVSSLTMAELSRVDLGSGQGFCSLREALVAFPSALFNIDVKSADAVLPTARAIRAEGAAHRVLVTSFSESRRRQLLRAVPGAATSASAQGITLMVAALALRQRWVLPRILRGIDAVQVPIRAGRLRIVSPRMIRCMHDLGIEVHVWTVNDPAQMTGLLMHGVDGIVTDRCDLAAGVIARQRGPLG
jgi:glycerophosphoryl diester phosphodiesterase